MAAGHSPLLVLLEKPLHLETTTFHFSHLLTTDTHVSLRTGSTHTENVERNKTVFWTELSFIQKIFLWRDISLRVIYRTLLWTILQIQSKTKQPCSPITNTENCKDLIKKEDLTLSFIRRSFTMKFATTDFIGEANWSGANIEIWPSETNGVISCSGTSAFKLLLRGWGKKSIYILKMSCRYVNHHA